MLCCGKGVFLRNMGFIKTQGVVIKEVNTGEADKIITIFSKGQGKISGFAKNARRTKNRIAAGTQLLCYSDFVLFKGKDMHNISSCDVIESFYEIREDVFKLTYSAHMIELINDVVQENQPATKVLQLFLNSMHFLSKTEKSSELIIRIFELRLLAILGYSPYVRGCVNCGAEDVNNISFSFKKCGFLCSNCAGEDVLATELSLGAVKAINHIVHAKIDELFNFNLSPQVLSEVGKVTKRYLKDRLERDYNKLDFLKTLEI